MSNQVCAVVAPLRDGWEAWVAFGLPNIYTDKQKSGHDAKEKLLDNIRQFADRQTLQQSLTVHWFDPYKHFTHCDTGFLYNESGNTDKFCTFLSYCNDHGDDRARVMVSTGEEVIIDPKWLKPNTIHKPWVSDDQTWLNPPSPPEPPPAPTPPKEPLGKLNRLIGEVDKFLSRNTLLASEIKLFNEVTNTLRQCRAIIHDARGYYANEAAMTKRDAEKFLKMTDSLVIPPTEGTTNT